MDKASDLTVRDIAHELGLHIDTVKRLLVAGHLSGYKADLKQWRVTRAALDQFKTSGGVRRPGRPQMADKDSRQDEQGRVKQ